jgi:predicted type IV restriction endonuclease
MTSSWGGYGGYLDFTQYNIASSPLVVKYWIQGTGLTCTVMAGGMAWIVVQVRRRGKEEGGRRKV